MVELVFLVAFNQGRSPNCDGFFNKKIRVVAPTAHITAPPPHVPKFPRKNNGTLMEHFKNKIFKT
jgi:hypothetical protein